MDIYKDLDDVKQAFTDFANKVPFYGAVVVCLDDPEVRSIRPNIKKRTISYGYNPQARVRAVNVSHETLNSIFTVISSGEELGKIQLQAPGDHNVKNALAAVAVGLELGISFEDIKSGLERFQGVFRRFQVKHNTDELIVIDDYAHHPTEVQASIQAARKGWEKRRIVAVFQPHLYSRTQQLYQEFGLSFFDAEVLVVTDVYPSREKPIEGVTGELISDTAKNYGHKNVHYVKEKSDLPETLKEILKDGDIVITMGAGDVYKYGEEFLELVNAGGG